MQMHHVKIFIIALVTFLIPTAAFSASVTLRWQANSEPDIASYNLYYGTQSRSYGPPVPVGNTTSHTVDNLTEGTTYYFALTAVDTSGNESGYSAEISANATSSVPATEPYRLLLSTNSDRSNAVELSGQTVSGGVFIFLDPEAYVSQVVFSIDGQTHNTENYAPYDLGEPFDTSTLSNGSHTISALVRLQNGTTDIVSGSCNISNISDSIDVPISQPPDSVSLQTSLSSPQTAGEIITVSANATGGSDDLEYQFHLKGPGTGNKWLIVQPYSSNATWRWNTRNSTGENVISVYVRRVGQTVPQEAWSYIPVYVISDGTTTPLESVELQTDRSDPQPAGEVVTVSANAIGGSGDLEYQFYLKGPGTGNKWLIVQDYSSNATWRWNTRNSTGENIISVYVRRVGSSAPQEAWNYIANYTIY